MDEIEDDDEDEVPASAAPPIPVVSDIIQIIRNSDSTPYSDTSQPSQVVRNPRVFGAVHHHSDGAFATISRSNASVSTLAAATESRQGAASLRPDGFDHDHTQMGLTR
jgi:hypothetical protein